jgi:very-short-patch-repair endonuclease
VPIGSYVVDFLCKEKKLIVELDGSQHNLQKGYDQRRTEFLTSQGYRVVRYWNNQVQQDGEAVLDDIFRKLEA